MSSSDPSDEQLKADTRDLLDIAIDEALQNDAIRVPLPLSDAGGIDWEDVAEGEDTLLDLVFICDARAQIENDQHSLISEVSWVRFALEGIKRVSQHAPRIKGLERLNLLRDVAMLEQSEAYQDMAARRMVVKGPDESDHVGLEYALRVARGEIVLGDTEA